jgi:uncharacterized protein YerC
VTVQERDECLDFIFDALVRINDRQERFSFDTSEDLDQIQKNIETLRDEEVVV